MCKINLNRLEEADTLPFKESRWRHLEREHGGMWNLRRWDGYSSDKAYSPYKLAERIIENNIGKSFDLAFSYYCSKIEKRYQYIFLKEFNHYRHWRIIYYIDDNGLIQSNIKLKIRKPVIIYSKDYKVALLHKKTKHNFDDFHERYSKKERNHSWKTLDGTIVNRTYMVADKLLGYRYKGNQYWAQKSDFENVIIQGYQQIFESKNDPRYIRIISERNKQQKIKDKLKKSKRFKISDQDFRRILKEKELKEKQLNLIKIESHGFDINTSFRK